MKFRVIQLYSGLLTFKYSTKI